MRVGRPHLVSTLNLSPENRGSCSRDGVQLLSLCSPARPDLLSTKVGTLRPPGTPVSSTQTSPRSSCNLVPPTPTDLSVPRPREPSPVQFHSSHPSRHSPSRGVLGPEGVCPDVIESFRDYCSLPRPGVLIVVVPQEVTVPDSSPSVSVDLSTYTSRRLFPTPETPSLRRLGLCVVPSTSLYLRTRE